MIDFEYAISLPPTIIEAFIRVVNSRSEEQQKDIDKSSGKNKNRDNSKPLESTPPPKLEAREKEKLKGKLDDFSNWMEEADFKERYNQAKAQTYSKENW